MEKRFADIVDDFTKSVEIGDGEQLSALFTEDGIYDDVFYGEFKGRRAITEMLKSHFHRDGENFCWQMFNPVDNGKIGYARWLFSYDCKLPHLNGKRIFMDGVGLFELENGLISRYEDAVRTAEVINQLEIPNDKQVKVVGKMLKKQMMHKGWVNHPK